MGSYSSNLLIEYQQAVEEGLDIQPYEDVFAAVARLPKNEIKKRLGDILFDVVLQAKTAKGYQYIEPSTLEEIRRLRNGTGQRLSVDKKTLETRFTGRGWAEFADVF